MKTDCSQFCCGAVLTQENDLGQEHPIAYFAKKLLLRERHFGTVEKECLAILLALKNFERYIFGVPITIITDHICLKWLMTISPHNSRLMHGLCIYKDIILLTLNLNLVLIIQTLVEEHFLTNCNHTNR